MSHMLISLHWPALLGALRREFMLCPLRLARGHHISPESPALATRVCPASREIVIRFHGVLFKKHTKHFSLTSAFCGASPRSSFIPPPLAHTLFFFRVLLKAVLFPAGTFWPVFSFHRWGWGGPPKQATIAAVLCPRVTSCARQ